MPAWTTTVRYSIECLSFILQTRQSDRAETYPDDTLRANELDQLVLDRALCITRAVSLKVSEVTDVTLAISRSSVSLAVRID